jgi:hypothetical protein
LRTDKNNNFKFNIKFLMTLDRSYIGYLGFLGIDLFKSVLMYSNGTICLIKLLFKMGLFTVQGQLSGCEGVIRSHFGLLFTYSRDKYI